jgi:UBX domain-containing protein 1
MFHTFDDYKDKNRDEKAEKDKRKTTDSYTGGKSSGIAVENPEDDDWLKKMKKHDDKEKYGKTKNKLKLTVYKNGFVIDGGEFRNKDEPANKKFMEEVEKGYIPNELVKKGITDLGIEVDDQRDKDYEPPKEEKKFHAFTGAGKSISSVSTQGLHVDKNATSNVDKSKPTCKVNIRLFNGEVVSEDFNLTQTLQDVINFVRKKSGSNNFSLLDGFPPRPITTYNKTIQELHLEGSLLTQKIN